MTFAFRRVLIFVALFLAALIAGAHRARAQVYILYNYNSTNGTIGEYGFDGTPINASLITGLQYSEAMAIAGGKLYVVNSAGGTVSVYNLDGTLATATLISGLHNPRGIAIDGSEIFITNYNTGTVGAYNLNGTTVNATLIAGLLYPIGIQAYGGQLYVTNDYESQISVYSETSGGTVTSPLIDNLDAFDFAIAGGTVFVASDYPNAVQTYSVASGAAIDANLIPSMDGLGGADITAFGGQLYIVNYQGVGQYNLDGTVANASFVTGLSETVAVVATAPTNAYETAVMNQSPLAYWPLSTTDGTSLVGSYTSSYLNGATTSVAGTGAPSSGVPVSAALSLSGANGSTPPYSATSLSGGIPGKGSIAAWVKLAELPSAAGTYFYIAGESQFANDFDLQFQNDNQLYIYTGAGENTTYAPNPATLVGQWHFVVATYDSAAGTRSLYWDGTLVSTYSGSVHTASKTNPFAIGYSTVFPGRDFDGLIDDVSVYGRALSGTEVATLYTAATGVPPLGVSSLPASLTVGQGQTATFSIGTTGGDVATFNYPTDVAKDPSGNIFVTDANNNLIREISPVTGGVTVSTFAGQILGGPAAGGFLNATGTSAKFDNPNGVAVDSGGNLYIADSFNAVIRKITPQGVVSTFAGAADQPGTADGQGTAAQFSNPESITIDSSGNLYVGDFFDSANVSRIRMITPGGLVSTLAGSKTAPGEVSGVVENVGNVDNATNLAVTPEFSEQPAGVAVDSSGNVYVADALNDTIRKVTPAGLVSTIAGTAGQAGLLNAPGTAAQFHTPYGIAIDPAGNLYVADFGNNAIRLITPEGVVSTLATVPSPTGLWMESSGSLLVAGDSQTIVEVTPAGVVRPVAGMSGVTGSANGAGADQYQWSFNGTPLAGQTGPTLTIPNVQAGNVGSYTVTVTNGAVTFTSAPATLALATVNEFFVANQTQGSQGGVAAYGPDGSTINSDLISNVVTPGGIATDGTNLYVSSLGAGTLGVYNLDGSVVNAAEVSGLDWPIGIAFQNGQTLIASTNANEVGLYNSDGSRANAALISGLSNPYGVVVAGGQIYVANYAANTVGEYNADGSVVNASLITGLSGPFGLAASSTELYVTNFQGGSVGEYNLDGSVVNATLITGLSQPTGIAVARSQLYVASFGSNTLGEYNLDGSVVNAAFITGLNGPVGVAVASILVPAPTVTTPPAAQTVNLGGSVTFTVAATGLDDTYVWNLNGTPIASANGPTLTINNATAANAGAYSVTVTDAAGTITSTGAQLTVNLAPTIVTQPGPAYANSFSFLDFGTGPSCSLIAGPDGTLYGVTSDGNGTVFKVHADGTGYAVLHAFSGADQSGANADGTQPNGPLVLSADGSTLYGTASAGGSNGQGTVFAVNTALTDQSGNGPNVTILHEFSALASNENTEGAAPRGNLVLSGTTLYGAASAGGPHSYGTVFSVQTNQTDTSGSGPNAAVLHSFHDGSGDGAVPMSGLILNGTTLYGVTSEGGANETGVAYAVATEAVDAGDVLNVTVLHTFSADNEGNNVDGVEPATTLILSNGTLYGVAPYGGAHGNGTVFAVQAAGADGNDGTNPNVVVLHTFSAEPDDETNADGAQPTGPLVLNGTSLYGVAEEGGANGDGTVFAVQAGQTDASSGGANVAVLYTFSESEAEGGYPEGGLLLSGSELLGVANGGGAIGNGSLFEVNVGTHAETTLYSFTGTFDGIGNSTSLVLNGSTLYGVSPYGGYGDGLVFKVQTDGTGLTILHTFSLTDENSDNVDGADPSGLVLSVDGSLLYGLTGYGGAQGAGTAFAVPTGGGSFDVLHSFNPSRGDGSLPVGSPVLSGTSLYGVTAQGGAHGSGTVFSVQTNASDNVDVPNVALLHSFAGGASDGSYPASGPVLGGATLYGTTQNAGANNSGTVYAVQAGGADGTSPNVTLLHSFSGTDGSFLQAPLVLGGTTLYGTAAQGGQGEGTVFAVQTGQTDAGLPNVTVLHTFTGGNDGAAPVSGLALSGTTLYGETPQGGLYGAGIVFSVQSNGVDGAVPNITSLHTFTGEAYDGAQPTGTLAVASNGVLYGAASGGGANGQGVIFSLDPTSSYSLASGADLLLTVAAADPAGDTYQWLLSGNQLSGATNDFLSLTDLMPSNDGNYTVDVTNDGVTTVSAATTVAVAANPSVATHFAVVAPANGAEGVPFTITVTALDANNNVVTDYAGTVRFVSSAGAGQITLPANGTLTNGVGTFTVTPLTVLSNLEITAVDASNNALYGTSGFTEVLIGAPAQFKLTAPAEAYVGNPIQVGITPQDAEGRNVQNYTGTVKLTTSDPLAVLPQNLTMTADANGVMTLTLNTPGTQTITVTDTANPSLSTSITVTVAYAGPATHFSVTAPAIGIEDIPFTITVTALDANNNVVTDYAGTVRFVSSASAGQITLPANGTLTNGVGTFTVTPLTVLSNLGITAVDASNNAVYGTSGLTSVDIGAPTQFKLTTPAEAYVGNPIQVGIAPEDQGNREVPNYTGTVKLTSGDPLAVLPQDLTMTAGANGVMTLTLNTPGTQTITVTDTANPSLSTSITVTVAYAGPATHFSVTAPAVGIEDIPFTITVTALDANNDVVTDYAGTVRFVSSASAGQITLPANGTLTNGVGTFTVTPLTVLSNLGITAVDASNNAVYGTSGLTSVDIGAPTQFKLTTPAEAYVGNPIQVGIAPEDQGNREVPNYTGTVKLTSGDPLAVLPQDLTMTAGANGVMTLTLNTPGTQTITVTDTANPSLSTSITVTVAYAGPATHFSVTAPAVGIEDIPFTITVTALDANNDVVTDYAGTVRFVSSASAGQITLPANGTLTNGVGTFTVTPLTVLFNLGITAVDASNNAVYGTSGLTDVNIGAPTQFRLTTPAQAYVGNPIQVGIAPEDQGNREVPNYTGTVKLTSSDPLAVLPQNLTMTAGANGVMTLTLNTPGTQMITVTDTANPSLSTSITVTVAYAGPATHFSVTAPAVGIEDIPFTITVTALDANNNVVTDYAGTVRFVSSASAGQITLPANGTLTNGVGTFTVTPLTVLSDLGITAVDASNNALFGSSGLTSVDIGAPTQFELTTSSPVDAGSPIQVTIVPEDQGGRAEPNYTGTVKLTSSDPLAVLPPNLTMTAGAHGVMTVTLNTTGTQTITVTDTGTLSLTSTLTVAVGSPAPATHFSVSALTETPDDSPFTVTVTALNASGGVVTGYAGTVHFLASEPASLPADGTLTDGTGTFTVTPTGTGQLTLTVVDPANDAVNGSSGPLTIELGSATQYRLSAGTPYVGELMSLTVVPTDVAGNGASYNGTFKVTSSDPLAVLPANYNTHGQTFNFVELTLNTLGTQTITVTDTADPSITSTITVTVLPAPATHFSVSAITETPDDAPYTITVTALNAAGGVVTGYTGTVDFTSSGPASLPANGTLTNGVGTFTVTPHGTGNLTITATDSVNGSITGTSAAATVELGAATQYLLEAGTAYVGQPFALTVIPADAGGNGASYNGTFKVTSSDPAAVLPPNYDTHGLVFNTVLVTLNTLGIQTITVTDTADPSITSTITVTVTTAPATHFSVSAPTETPDDSPFTVTVTALNAGGGVVTGYTGTVQFTASESASLPANAALSGGTGTFTVTPHGTGSLTLTVADTANGAITGSSGPLTIELGLASKYLLSASTPYAGEPMSLTVIPADVAGNGASYDGTFKVTSSDPLAILPLNYNTRGLTFNTVELTLNTLGTQTITVTDTVDPSITSTITVTVVAAPASIVTQPQSDTALASGSASFTVQATGFGPLTYQWTFNGHPIAGATSASYALSHITVSESGAYAVIVTNPGGSTTSQSALLTIPATPGAPSVGEQPVSHDTYTDGTVIFTVGTTGTTGEDVAEPRASASAAADTYQWYFNGVALADGNGVIGSQSPTLELSGAAAQAGSYTCLISNAVGSVLTNPATLTVTPTSDIGRLINLSCLAQAGTGSNSLIAGFVVGGGGASGSDGLLVRGSGPALIPFGVANTLADPQLQLFATSPQVSLLATNTGWDGSSAIITAAASVGAFPWVSAASSDAALLQTLPMGQYTANITGVTGDTGNALVELYDTTPGGTYAPSMPRLINFSSRAQAGPGGNALIVGFVIGGSTAKTVLIRAAGPALAAYGVAGTLPDPQITLFSTGSVVTPMASNAGWAADPTIAATAAAVGAFSWGASATPDSAILVTLPPGSYTANVTGVSGDSGVALVEVYEVQ